MTIADGEGVRKGGVVFLYLVLPILLITVFVGVDTWPCRVGLLGVVGLCLALSSAAALAVSVMIIIGVAFRNSLHGITGSSV